MSEEDSELPSAVHALLVKVRQGLKNLGDDGSAKSERAKVSVHMGWREIRAIYAMHIAMQQARTARDNWKMKFRMAEKKVEKPGLDRLTLNLLRDVESILSGEETSERAVRDVLQQVRSRLPQKKS